MNNAEPNSSPKVAMYWDFENIHISLHEKEVGPYKSARFKPQPDLIDVAAIMDYARSVGNVCINRAYCNWSFFSAYSDALSGHGMELVQLFPRGMHGKNGADIQMCVDMVEDLLKLQVDVCVIISGDSDFIGAAQKARQYGKRVIGIGVRNFSNRLFQRVCDEFKFYDTLVEAEEAVAMPVMAETSGKMTLDAAKQLLVAALRRLASQLGEPSVLKTRLKQMMLRLEPAFDERGLPPPEGGAAFANFSAFLAACTDVIEEMPGDSQSVRLKAGVTQPSPPPLSDKTRQECQRLLVASMTYMLRQRDSVQMGPIKQTMLKLKPDFDTKKLGAKNLSTFLRWFPDVVAIRGEGDKQTLELLVAKDTCGYPPPPLPASKLSEMLPAQEVIDMALLFHLESLQPKPAASWTDYQDRMRASVEAAGLSIERTGLVAVKKVLFEAHAFKTHAPGDPGGISLADEITTLEQLRALFTQHQARLLQTEASDSMTQASGG